MSHLHPTVDPPATERADAGQATAEYAVCTVGAVIIALLIDQLVTDGTITDLLRSILEQAFGHPWFDLMDGKPFTPLRAQ